MILFLLTRILRRAHSRSITGLRTFSIINFEIHRYRYHPLAHRDVRGPSTLHAESPLLADFAFQLFPSLPLTAATLSGPDIPLQLISSLPLALPFHHTAFRSISGHGTGRNRH